MISDRIQTLEPSPTLELNQKAKEYKAAGRPVINFTAGEPDFNTPVNICEAGKRAIDEGKTKYTPSAGIVELRQAIVDRTKKDYDLDYSPSEVLVSSGAKQSLFNLFFSVLNPGDEVILFSPYWVSYPEMAKIAGAKSVFVDAVGEEDFALPISKLKSVLTEKTKLVVINTPSNPSGAVLKNENLAEAVEAIENHSKALIACDDIYRLLYFEGDKAPSPAHHVKDRNRLVIINGVSKSHAMTGWRIGYALANGELISAMNRLQSQSTSGAASISQYAALEAIRSDDADLGKMRKEFLKRRDVMFDGLSALEHVRASKPEGAFYAFPDFREFLDAVPSKRGIDSDVRLCEYLLEEENIAAVPGSAFGAPGFLRFSFALGEKDIEEGMARLKKGCVNLLK